MDFNLPTIAIAEDNKITRTVIRHFLCQCNYEVVIEADNGKALIEQLENAKVLPDVCLMDINMPVMDGFETTRQLKQRWPSIKVLAITEDDCIKQFSKMAEMGADGSIPKLCTMPELNKAIMDLIKK